MASLERSLDPTPSSLTGFQEQIRVSGVLVLELLRKKKVLLARLVDPTIKNQLQALPICLTLLLVSLMLLL